MDDKMLTGRQGEEVAAEYLTAKGYTILDKNWRAGQLEIDLVALDGEELVFVEVKSRTAPALVAPSMAVTRKKQRALIRAANVYVSWKGRNNECRFDIISVLIEPLGEHIEHMENAFYPLL
jgi:putative endonuclease